MTGMKRRIAGGRRKALLDIVSEISDVGYGGLDWWRNAWANNLERFPEFSSKVLRGKQLWRDGLVSVSEVFSGRVVAFVRNGEKGMHRVEVIVMPLNAINREFVRSECMKVGFRKEDLYNMAFRDDFRNAFVDKEKGLLPKPVEFVYGCSCGEPEIMCKHTAAVLYSIGDIIGDRPECIFELRGVEMEVFLAFRPETSDFVVAPKTVAKTSRILDDLDISEIFGI